MKNKRIVSLLLTAALAVSSLPLALASSVFAAEAPVAPEAIDLTFTAGDNAAEDATASIVGADSAKGSGYLHVTDRAHQQNGVRIEIPLTDIPGTDAYQYYQIEFDIRNSLMTYNWNPNFTGKYYEQKINTRLWINGGTADYYNENDSVMPDGWTFSDNVEVSNGAKAVSITNSLTWQHVTAWVKISELGGVLKLDFTDGTDGANMPIDIDNIKISQYHGAAAKADRYLGEYVLYDFEDDADLAIVSRYHRLDGVVTSGVNFFRADNEAFERFEAVATGGNTEEGTVATTTAASVFTTPLTLERGVYDIFGDARFAYFYALNSAERLGGDAKNNTGVDVVLKINFTDAEGSEITDTIELPTATKATYKWADFSWRFAVVDEIVYVKSIEVVAKNMKVYGNHHSSPASFVGQHIDLKNFELVNANASEIVEAEEDNLLDKGTLTPSNNYTALDSKVQLYVEFKAKSGTDVGNDGVYMYVYQGKVRGDSYAAWFKQEPDGASQKFVEVSDEANGATYSWRNTSFDTATNSELILNFQRPGYVKDGLQWDGDQVSIWDVKVYEEIVTADGRVKVEPALLDTSVDGFDEYFVFGYDADPKGGSTVNATLQQNWQSSTSGLQPYGYTQGGDNGFMALELPIAPAGGYKMDTVTDNTGAESASLVWDLSDLELTKGSYNMTIDLAGATAGAKAWIEYTILSDGVEKIVKSDPVTLGAFRNYMTVNDTLRVRGSDKIIGVAVKTDVDDTLYFNNAALYGNVIPEAGLPNVGVLMMLLLKMDLAERTVLVSTELVKNGKFDEPATIYALASQTQTAETAGWIAQIETGKNKTTITQETEDGNSFLRVKNPEGLGVWYNTGIILQPGEVYNLSMDLRVSETEADANYTAYEWPDETKNWIEVRASMGDPARIDWTDYGNKTPINLSQPRDNSGNLTFKVEKITREWTNYTMTLTVEKPTLCVIRVFRGPNGIYSHGFDIDNFSITTVEKVISTGDNK